MISLRDLEVRAGQRWTQRLWTRLLQAIDERTVRKGGGVHFRRGSDGIHVRASGGRGASAVAHPWQMQAQEDGEKVLVSFTKAFVNGVEPKIGERMLSELDENDDSPDLEVTANDFDEERVCRIYVKTKWNNPGWYVETAEMKASNVTLPATAWTHYKLVGLLMRDEAGGLTTTQVAFFHLKITPVERNLGFAEYITGVAS